MTRVLVVDDDTGILDTLRWILEDAGYLVSSASDGMAALKMLRETTERTVVLLDLVMPVLSGEDFLRIVATDAQLTSRHAYMMITANGPLMEPVLASLPPEVASSILVIHKPFDMDILLYLVEQAARYLRGEASDYTPHIDTSLPHRRLPERT